MAKRKIPAITPKTFEKMVSQWARIARPGESGSLYFSSKAGFLWRYKQFLEDKKIYQKYFGSRKTSLIDLDSLVLEKESDWEEIVEKEKAKGATVFFALGLDRLLKEREIRILTYLERGAIATKNLSFIFIFHFDFTHPQFESVWKSKSLFIQNIAFQPFFGQEDGIQFLKWLEKEWRIKIKPAFKREILLNCGGRFWLIKEAVRYLRDHPRAKIGQIFGHKQMEWRLKMLWQEMLASERVGLEKIIRKQKEFTPWEKHSLNFMAKVGWLSIPLFEKYLKNKLLKIKLEVDRKGRIYLNKVSVENNFSAQEKAVLVGLLTKKNRLVSREETAHFLWQEKWEDSYSDWAIDQTISRIRKRLEFLKLEPGMLETIRGKGFVLSPKPKKE